MKRELLDQFFAHVERERLFSSRRCLQYYLDFLFRDTSFDQRRMLDVGGGYGLYSLYAACMGAEKVVCVEPVSAGSLQDTSERLARLRSSFADMHQVVFVPSTLQDLGYSSETFDIILLHDSINHLDEEACSTLRHSPLAVESYEAIFGKLSDLASQRAKLIITDCSRYNFFALCGVKNPLAPNIEWHEHQSPQYWARMLSEAGFRNAQIRWTSFNRLGFAGELVLGNRLVAYFLRSHFLLTMEKGDSPLHDLVGWRHRDPRPEEAAPPGLNAH